MKKLFVFIIFLLGLALAQTSEMLEFPVQEAIKETVPLQTGSSEMIRLELAKGSSELSVQVGSSKQTLSITLVKDGAPTPASLLAADFNFDGFTDLAIPETEGYGGVNYFYMIYLYNEKGFEAISLPEADLACNPYLEKETQTIKTSCKSGPIYYRQDFRFENSKPYISFENAQLSVDAIGGLFWVETTYDSDGKKLSVTITNNADDSLPATVTWDKLRLYTSPDKASRTDIYLEQGHEVEIIALNDDNTWVNISYKDENGQAQTAWVKPLEVFLD